MFRSSTSSFLVHQQHRCRAAFSLQKQRQRHQQQYQVAIYARRTLLMDARTRPSHSGMIGAPPTTKPPPLSSTIEVNSTTDLTFIPWPNLAARVLLAVSLVHMWTEHVLDITLCEGPSMEPTLHDSGEIIVMQKIIVQTVVSGQVRRQQNQQLQQQNQSDDDVWHEPYIAVNDMPRPTWKEALLHIISPLAVGDVVVVRHPTRPGTVCKRILGLPGDLVMLAESMRYNNSNSRGVAAAQEWQKPHLIVVPDGHMWLEGDNPANSSDSRSYGPIPVALLVGRVVARIWPLRGNAWMMRGAPPRNDATASTASASTVLPAGYEGQEIVTTWRDVEKQNKNKDNNKDDKV